MAPLAPAIPILATIGKVAAIGGAATSVVGAATGNKTLKRIGMYTGLAGAGLGLGAGIASAATGAAGAGATAGAVANAGSNAPLSIMDKTLNLSAATGASGSTSAAGASTLAESASAFNTSTASVVSGSTSAMPTSINTGIHSATPTSLNISSSTNLASSKPAGAAIKDSFKANIATNKDNALNNGVKVATVGTGIYSAIESSSIQKEQIATQKKYYNDQIKTEKDAKRAAFATAKENRSKAAAYGYNLSNYSTALNNLYSGSYSTTSGSAGVYTPAAKQYSLLG
jgi:hypothetical protein